MFDSKLIDQGSYIQCTECARYATCKIDSSVHEENKAKSGRSYYSDESFDKITMPFILGHYFTCGCHKFKIINDKDRPMMSPLNDFVSKKGSSGEVEFKLDTVVSDDGDIHLIVNKNDGESKFKDLDESY